MSRSAVFIDAGYFWVQASQVVLGSRKAKRTDLTIDYGLLHKAVLDEVTLQFPRSDLLRVYWYDGPGQHLAKGPDHHEIDKLDDFKLRLGTRNGVGQQKAVDGLIIADMLSLIQSRSIENALLITGDADMTPGVTAAQALGLRVHLVTMGPAGSTSPFLAADVDRKVIWGSAAVGKFAKAAPIAVTIGQAPPIPLVPPQTSPTLAVPASTGAAPSPASTGAAPSPASTGAAPSPPSTGAAPSPASTGAPSSPPSTGAAPSPASTGAAPFPASAGAASSPASTIPVTKQIHHGSSIATLPIAVKYDVIAKQVYDKLKIGTHAATVAAASKGSAPLDRIIDSALLRDAASSVGRSLEETEKRQLRVAFKKLL